MLNLNLLEMSAVACAAGLEGQRSKAVDHTHTHKTQTEPLVNAETTSRRKFTLCASLFLMWHMQYNYSVENILHLTKIFMIGERSKISNVINVCSCCLLIKSLKILPIRLCYYRRFICQG